MIYDTNILQEGGLNSNAGPQAHSFQVSAIASSGDVDSTPSTFEWTTTGSAGLEAIPQEQFHKIQFHKIQFHKIQFHKNNSTRSNSTRYNPTRTTTRYNPQEAILKTPNDFHQQFRPSELPTGLQSQQQQPQITVQGPLAPSGFVPSELPTGLQSQQQQPQITVQGPLAPNTPVN